jgi:hypothetical protein
MDVLNGSTRPDTVHHHHRAEGTKKALSGRATSRERRATVRVRAMVAAMWTLSSANLTMSDGTLGRAVVARTNGVVADTITTAAARDRDRSRPIASRSIAEVV